MRELNSQFGAIFGFCSMDHDYAKLLPTRHLAFSDGLADVQKKGMGSGEKISKLELIYAQLGAFLPIWGSADHPFIGEKPLAGKYLTASRLSSCLYRTLTRAVGIWDYLIKGIDSVNCRFVQTLVANQRGQISICDF